MEEWGCRQREVGRGRTGGIGIKTGSYAHCSTQHTLPPSVGLGVRPLSPTGPPGDVSTTEEGTSNSMRGAGLSDWQKSGRRMVY